MLPARDGLQPGSVRVDPLELEVSFIEVGEVGTDQGVFVLVVIDQEHSQAPQPTGRGDMAIH